MISSRSISMLLSLARLTLASFLMLAAVVGNVPLPPFEASEAQAASFTQTCWVTRAVSASTDDAYQLTAGNYVSPTSTAMGGSLDATTEWVGMRFQDIPIPQGATISSATISVVPSGTGEDEPLVNIYMQDTDDAGAFNVVANDISSRSRTSGVAWSSTNLGASGSTYHNSPSLTSIVQTVVDRGGWASGNDMAVIIQGGSTGSRDLTIEGWDLGSGGVPTNPPILEITYSASDCAVGKAVAASADDAQQSGTTVTTNGTTIGGALDATTEWVGLRFQDIGIPEGSTITAASISIVPSTANDDEPLVTLYMEDTDDAAAFTTGTSNISNRSRTSGVSWSSTNLGATGFSYHDSPNLSAIVQTVVDRDGWASGNDMAVIIQGGANTSRDLTIKAFDNTATIPAFLNISYTEPVIDSPTVTTSAASSVTASSATFNGEITATGGANATVRGFANGTSADLTTNTSTTTANGSFGTGAFTAATSTLAGNTAYYFRAYATNTTGTGYGSIQSLLSLPGTPGTVSWGSVTATSSSLSWSAPTGGAASYKLVYCNTSGTCVQSNGLAGLSTTTNPLVGNTTYTARVQGTNATGDGSLSASTTQLTLPDVPGTPTNFTEQSTTMEFEWTAPAGGAASYKIERCDGVSCSDFEQIASGVTDLSYEDVDLIPNTSYSYRVRATNATGDGLYSGIGGEATDAAAPSVITNAATDITLSSATLNGEITATGGSTASVVGFAYGTNATLSGGDTATTTENGTFGIELFEEMLDSLSPGATYYVRAYATNTAGTGYGSVMSFTIFSAPTVTTNAATLVAGTTATLNGEITATGGQNATSRGFAWGTDSGLSSNTSTTTSAAGYDISTGAFDEIALSVAEEETGPLSMLFNDDGTVLYVTGFTGDDINAYTLSTPYDISTGVFDEVALSVAAQETGPTDMLFNNDGTVLYVVGVIGDDINAYTLSTPYDISTGVFDEIALSVAAQETDPNDILFNDDGTVLYVLGASGSDINAYTLSTPYDISTGVFDEIALSVAAQDISPYSALFNDDGTVLYVLGNDGDDINAYTLSTPYDISTGVFDEVALSVAAQEVTPVTMLFNDVGSVLYVLGYTGRDINAYTLDTTESFGTGSFSAALSSLSLDTTYYFRAYAANEYGTSTGEILSFATDNIPTVTTDATTDIVATSSTLNGEITDTGGQNATVRGFAYTTSSDLTTNVSTTTNSGSFGEDEFDEEVGSLTGNTTYYARAYAANPYGTAFGSIVSFLTRPDVPGTPDFTGVAQTTLTVFWAAPTGGATSYKLERCDGADCSDFEQIASGVTTFNAGVFYYDDTDLSPGTTYSYRVRGTNATGNGLYSAVGATTTPTGPPAVTSEAATSIGTNSATANADLTATGGLIGEGTAHGFAWGTEATLAGGDTATTTLGAYSAIGLFSELLSGLRHDTTYYFRAYATNANSTVLGNILSFMTKRNYGGGGGGGSADIGGPPPEGDGIVGGGEEGGGEDIEEDPPPEDDGDTGGGGSGGGGDI